MNKIIVVAGATGNLGSKIVHNLISLGAEVRFITRNADYNEKIEKLEKLGAKKYVVKNYNADEIAKICIGASCVVSALAGLREVIIDAQTQLLDGAIKAGVPRFIPSDYSIDFTKFSDGENRNLDLRRQFHTILDKRPIQATSIYNGAFADMLTNEMPMILYDKKIVIHWGDAEHKMIFTTVADTAAYTALVALDDTAPRSLHIAGDQTSAKSIRATMEKLKGAKHRLIKTGGPGLLSFIIKIAKIFDKGDKELYPAWQGMQYMRNMIDKRSVLEKTDNGRYPNFHWTKVEDVVVEFIKKIVSK